MAVWHALTESLLSDLLSPIYGLMMTVIFLETRRSIGLLIPASAFLLVMGSVSSFYSFPLASLIFVATLTAIIGDHLNFFLARKSHSPLPIYQHGLISKRDVKIAKLFLKRWHSISPFLARLIPGKKETIPLIWGASGKKYWLFFPTNILGCFIWSTLWLSLGFYLSLTWNLANFWLSRASLLYPIFLSVFILLYGVKWLVERYGLSLFYKAKNIGSFVGRRIQDIPYVRLWQIRNPHMNIFLSERFDTSDFWGLPTTLFALVFLYLFLLFSGITEDFLTGDAITYFDSRVANIFILLRSDWLTPLMLWITYLGKALTIVMVVFGVSIILYILNRRIYLLPLWFMAGSVTLLTFAGKFLFHRARPEYPIYQEISYSFPSAHASIAIGLYGYLAYIMICQKKSWEQKVNIVYLTTILIFLIGFSRIYLGVHYTSDILSGYLLGGLLLTFGIAFTEWLKKSHPQRNSAQNRVYQPILVGIILCAMTACFVYIGVEAHPQQLTDNKAELQTIQKAEELFYDSSTKYTETITGKAQEPINIILIAKDDVTVSEAFMQQGWLKADTLNLNTIYSFFKQENQQSHTAPPAFPIFWQAHTQTISFVLPAKEEAPEQQIWLWKAARIIQSDGTKLLYVGMTHQAKDSPKSFIPKIEPNLNIARDKVVQTMKNNPLNKYSLIQLTEPLIAQTIWNSKFYSDGTAALLEITQEGARDE